MHRPIVYVGHTSEDIQRRTISAIDIHGDVQLNIVDTFVELVSQETNSENSTIRTTEPGRTPVAAADV